MNNDILPTFGNKLRVRACGFCWEGEKLLLVNHNMYGKSGFWAPPGGGVEFGQNMEAALVREFAEETGLLIEVTRFRFVAEYIKTPLHAIEFFFDVKVTGGALHTGFDPEMSPENQIIEHVEFLSYDTIQSLSSGQKHGIFGVAKNLTEMRSMSGFYRI